MANRRMFSNRIANSARFLQMPEGSQLLYFHMILRADDDGVVEAYPLIKLLGSAPDSFKVLMAKGFVKELNEDQVIIILDWDEHNKIRADRKVNSIYTPLIKEKCPELQLKAPQPRSDVEDNSRRTDGGQSTDSIGKVSLSKVKLGKDKTNTLKVEFEDKKIIELTKLLYSKVKENYPFLVDKKTDIQWHSDYKEMDKINRIDGRDLKTIQFIILWSQNDSFWKQNIRSVKKLRIKFDDLMVRAKGQVDARGIKDYD